MKSNENKIDAVKSERNSCLCVCWLVSRAVKVHDMSMTKRVAVAIVSTWANRAIRGRLRVRWFRVQWAQCIASFAKTWDTLWFISFECSKELNGYLLHARFPVCVYTTENDSMVDWVQMRTPPIIPPREIVASIGCDLCENCFRHIALSTDLQKRSHNWTSAWKKILKRAPAFKCGERRINLINFRFWKVTPHHTMDNVNNWHKMVRPPDECDFINAMDFCCTLIHTHATATAMVDPGDIIIDLARLFHINK